MQSKPREQAPQKKTSRVAPIMHSPQHAVKGEKPPVLSVCAEEKKMMSERGWTTGAANPAGVGLTRRPRLLLAPPCLFDWRASATVGRCPSSLNRRRRAPTEHVASPFGYIWKYYSSQSTVCTYVVPHHSNSSHIVRGANDLLTPRSHLLLC